ncbi:MAG: helix-turn-helix transcriptional regulator [Clostridiales bacterium]|nr:helix-turn-helix transcriptional regulator [Clostridiales bacterium]MCF8022093.1 helix-turn-helix transcriptional regulator [Clostridiales bacterium]
MENSAREKYKCPLEYTQKVIGGKWKPIILWYLSTEGVKRYGELKKFLAKISHKMLSQQLKELEKDKLIHREEYHQIPPKVEYSITEKGKTLLPILELMNKWGLENKEN